MNHEQINEQIIYLMIQAMKNNKRILGRRVTGGVGGGE